MAAKKEKQQMKHLEEPKFAYVILGAKKNQAQIKLKVSHCTHCRKNYYTPVEC